MAILKAEQIPDLVVGTLEKYGEKPRFRLIAQKLQDYEVLPRWFKKDKVTYKGGYGWRQPVMFATGQSFRHVGLYQEDAINVSDVLDAVAGKWCHGSANYTFDRHEVLMNQGAERLVNIMRPKRAGCLLDIAQGLEDAAWSLPDPADTSHPWGVPYWIVPGTGSGFTGLAAPGFTAVGGIDPVDQSKWRNYSDTYAEPTRADLLEKFEDAHRFIQFKSPVSVPDMITGRGDRFRIYVNNVAWKQLKNLARQQNQDLGVDLGSLDGQFNLKKNPIVWVPKLDELYPTTGVIYLLNHDTFYPVVLSGDYMTETKPTPLDKMHNVFVTYIDISYNYANVDRRANAVIVQS